MNGDVQVKFRLWNEDQVIDVWSFIFGIGCSEEGFEYLTLPNLVDCPFGPMREFLGN